MHGPLPLAADVLAALTALLLWATRWNQPQLPWTGLLALRDPHPLVALVNWTIVPFVVVLGPPSQVGGLQYSRDSYPSHSFCNRGEVWVRAMAHPEVDILEADTNHTCMSTNPHGPKPPSWGTFKRLRPHEKRSYKRARRRALRDGYVWYKGQLFDRKHFNCDPLPDAVTTLPKSCSPSVRPQRAARNRLHLMAWNGR